MFPPDADSALRRISTKKPRERPMRPIIQLGPGIKPGARLTCVVFSTGLLSTKNPLEGSIYTSWRIFVSTNWRHPLDTLFNLPKGYRMAGPEPITPNERTSNQNVTRSVIEGRVLDLKELLKEPNNQNLIKPMLLDFDDIQDSSDEETQEAQGGAKGKAKAGDEDLSKPFKEALKCPFTRRIVEFSSPGHRMSANVKIYDGTGDPEDHIGRFVGARAWFDKLSSESIDDWGSLQEKFLNRFGMLKACDKDPTEISKIVRKANKTLPRFKERWVSESNVIPNVPELMQISSFMSFHKCPELAKRFSDSIPKTVDEMLKRVDDYLRSEEAFRGTELPRGEFQRRDAPVQWVQQNDRYQRFPFGNNRRRSEHKPAARTPERHGPYVPPQRPNQEFRRPRAVLTLNSLSITPQEILATEHQLNLPQPVPLVGVPSKENLNRYCDYHNEKGHNTNDCFHLKQQLEIALESGKLNHLVKDVRQRGRGATEQRPTKGKDEWASVEIMFEHCFNMLHPSVRSRLVETQTTVSGFSIEQVKPLGKIKLDVCFGGSGRCRRAIMKFTIIPTPSPYNIILGRPGLKQLKAILSTIHGMMKFPTPWGVDTLVSQTPVVFECRKEGKKQAVETPKEKEKHETAGPTEQSVIAKEVAEWLKAGIVRPMAEEDEEKTAFYTDQGTYCYTKMPFGLKNTGATYQRLVDDAFQSQVGRNMEVYVDDMVIKSKFEREMLADIAKTFDNLRRINMKLNPKKCSFGVTEGKFLGYMVTSEGIRANPAKTKDIAEMQSPRVWWKCKV
ncbi:reverse transcriptase domain-containing protein [Tanacetum coccineum]